MRVRAFREYDAIIVTAESREEWGIDPTVPEGFVAVISDPPVRIVALLSEEEFVVQYETVSA